MRCDVMYPIMGPNSFKSTKDRMNKIKEHVEWLNENSDKMFYIYNEENDDFLYFGYKEDVGRNSIYIMDVINSPKYTSFLLYRRIIKHLFDWGLKNTKYDKAWARIAWSNSDPSNKSNENINAYCKFFEKVLCAKINENRTKIEIIRSRLLTK